MILQSSLVIFSGMGADRSSTARVERAHSYRARSAIKKGTWPLPPLPPQRPPMPVPLHQRIRFTGPPAPGGVEVGGSLAG